MRPRLALLGAALLLALLCVEARNSQRKCRTILQSVKAKYPATSEFLNTLRALTVRRIPTLNAPRDVYAPSNRLMIEILNSYGMSLEQTKKPGLLWTNEQKNTLATAIRKKLIYVPEDGPGSCGNITFIDTLSEYNQLKSGKKPQGHWTVESTKTFTRAAGDSAPIYQYNGDYNSNPNVNNNTGLVGTGYNIFFAGPNAWSSGPTGVDPGFTYYPIFSMFNGFTYGLADSGECTQSVSAMYSAQESAKSTHFSLTGSATYDGVTGGANVGFQNNLNYQTSSQTVTTMYSCPSSYFAFELKDTYAIETSDSQGYEVFDTEFYQQTVSVMNDLIEANYDWNQVTATLGPWVHQYGTHFVTTSYSGAYLNQVCSMSNYAYSYAKSNSFSWGASLKAGAVGLNTGGGDGSNTSSSFESVNAQCTTSMTPGSVAIPIDDGQPNTQQWLQNAYNAGRLMPGYYQLANITALFDYPHLWGNGKYTSAQLQQIGSAIQDYIESCAPGAPDQPPSCPVPSSNCASQTFFDGNSCQSCYTAGPQCSMAGNPQSGAITGCTATTCNCNPPWTGTQCLQFNLGTCYAESGKRKKDGKEKEGKKETRQDCTIYSNCCAPGFNAAPNSDNDHCRCQCQPEGNVNGYTGGGACGNRLGYFCGNDCGSDCTDDQGNGPYTCN